MLLNTRLPRACSSIALFAARSGPAYWTRPQLLNPACAEPAALGLGRRGRPIASSVGQSMATLSDTLSDVDLQARACPTNDL